VSSAVNIAEISLTLIKKPVGGEGWVSSRSRAAGSRSAIWFSSASVMMSVAILLRPRQDVIRGDLESGVKAGHEIGIADSLTRKTSEFVANGL
jgi:hypothetical protein